MAYRGWLIYDEAGIKRNKWFAEQLLESAHQHGLELELKVLPTQGLEWRETETELREGILHHMGNEWEQTTVPEFVIMRVIAPELSQALEERGIRLFNNARTSCIANDKWLTYEWARRWEIPVLETERADAAAAIEGVAEAQEQEYSPAYPMVIKAVAGHGGSQVYWAENAEQHNEVLQELQSQSLSPWEIILQQPCSEPGKDMRVYVLGKEIYQAVLRSASQDFRSNFSLGGTIELAEPTQEQRQIVERLWQELQFDFVGIDFLPHNGKWVLNEIEDVVGTRMLYQLTDRDVVQDYLTYIGEQLNGGS